MGGMLVTVHDGSTGALRTVFLEIDRSDTVGAVRSRLVAITGADISGADRRIAVDGVEVAPSATVAQSGLREGSFVSLLNGADPIPDRTRMVDSTVQLRVVSGAGAGRIMHVGVGTVLIGREKGAHIVVTDPSATARDVALVVASDATVTLEFIEDQTPACVVDGEPPTSGMTLSPGAQLAYADMIVEVARPDSSVAAVQLDPPTGQWKYNRPPRILPPEPSSSFRLPSEPQEPDKPPLPVLMSLLPLLMAVGLAFLYRNPVMLAFGIMSPIMLIGSYITTNRTARRRYRRMIAEYADVKARTEQDAADALAAERVTRRVDAPDPAHVGLIAVGPSPRLWERRRDEALWLTLRVGTATQPSRVSLEDPEQLQHRQHVVWDVHDAPVTVALPEAGVFGVASSEGHIDTPRRVAQWLVAQLGALHSPKEVQLYVLEGYAEPSSPYRGHPWEFAAWLPHLQPTLGQQAVRTVGTTTASLATRVAELAQLLDARLAARRTTGATSAFGPALVVVLDGASRLRTLPGVVRLLKEGPAVGIFAICVERDERLLPEECHTVLVTDGHRGRMRMQRTATTENLLLDLVDEDWLDWVCRAISPIVDVSPSVSDAAIPTSSRLLDVLGLDTPSPDALRARWALNPRSTTAIIGESLDGPFAIDLVSDGPHGLVGGTSGSGKSEFLQTLVASLAVANSPAEMNFVLVDYKGGAAFKDCAMLPHTVGMVTDLDAHLVERALESLSAELKRREHVLSAAGAKDLEDYQDLAARRGLEPVPRLVVVVDEFASLARELPDFVVGLVNLAQRGRSLGIHMILATQRPSGAVSPEIRANTNLRIALRMTDGAESADVIDAPDAGMISPAHRGRGYARLDANALIPFQTSRVGGRAPTGRASTIPDPIVRTMSFGDLSEPAPRPPVVNDDGNVEITDLGLLVAAVGDAARAARIPAGRQPWLPALPDTLALEELDSHASHDAVSSTAIWFGLEDHPSDQAQLPAVFDLDTDGHLYVIGAPRSGRTTVLRTIAASAALTLSPTDLHIYGIDAGNGGLLPLRRFPHVGAVAMRNQTDQVVRLIGKLRTLVTQRQQLLAEASVSDLAQLRSLRGALAEESPAHVLVLLDGWEAFQSAFETVDGGALIEAIVFLLREGASAGVHLVVSGDRQLLISGRMSTLAERKLLLRMIERSDYSLIGLRPKSLPEDIPNGRAFDSAGTELHIASLDPNLAPAAQSAALLSRGDELAERYRGVARHALPFGILEIPTRYRLSDALTERGSLGAAGSVFVGLGGEDVEPVTFDPRIEPTFVVAGPPGSGRSNTLMTIAESALSADHELVVLAPRRSPLRDLDGRSGVRGVLTGDDVTEEDLAPLLAAHGEKTTMLIADDAELLREASAKAWLRGLIPQAPDHQLAVVIAGDPDALGKGFSSWLLEVIKGRRGVLFKPTQLTDGDTVGIRLSRSDLAAAVEHPVGRGYVAGRGASIALIQVPLTETEAAR